MPLKQRNQTKPNELDINKNSKSNSKLENNSNSVYVRKKKKKKKRKEKKVVKNVTFRNAEPATSLVGWLMFYGISTLVGYLMPNPVLCTRMIEK